MKIPPVRADVRLGPPPDTAWTAAACRGLIGQRPAFGDTGTRGLVVDAHLDRGDVVVTVELPLTVHTRPLTPGTIAVSIGFADPDEDARC